MTFLAPAFFAALAALAIPVLVHLIQRERKQVVPFPSLMFLRRIPYKSVRRRRIHHWLLLVMRVAALALIVLAFARPFFKRGPLAAATSAGAREVVVLLDRSASMGYGDHWTRARAAARQAIARLGRDDRATLVLFAASAEENVRATGDRARLTAAVDAAAVGSGATRFGPALKLAESVLARSRLTRREVVLISDFQKTGWSGAEDVRFPAGAVLTTVSVASDATTNLSVASAAIARASFSGKERITITAGIRNHGTNAVANLPVSLEVDGEQVQRASASVAPGASASVTFQPFTLAAPNVRATIRAGTDPLPADNVFHVVLTPSRPVSVLIVDDGRSRSSLYLLQALAIGTTPAFHAEDVPVTQVTAGALAGRQLVVLNDVPFPAFGSTGALTHFVEQGGGLLVVLGEGSTWRQSEAALLPGQLGPAVDPPSGHTSTPLGALDYSHPVFELFKAPRSGDFSGVHVYRYRALTAGADDRVLARYDDGGAAVVERRIGKGRVIALSTTLDESWNDLAVKPVFLPLVHQMARYLAQYEEPAAWHTVGQAVDLSPPSDSQILKASSPQIVLTPSGRRVPLTEDEGASFVELEEQGFYQVRTSTGAANRPYTVAANLDPAESDLTPMDPQELAAAATGRATQQEPEAFAATVTPEQLERRQALWWYLLFAGALLLAAETVLSNRYSRRQASERGVS
ncbi:MAG: BatA domain-containing protein [Betaproteobacteria bacterium]